MERRDSAGLPTRRPSWTGGLGAKLGRILSPHEEQVDEDAYRTLPDDASVASVPSLRKMFGDMVVVGKKEGE